MDKSWPGPPLRVVLVEPEIPPNTGNIARTCAATGTRLDLVHPLGFEINDKQLRRAGLDYWPHVDLHEHASLEACLDGQPQGRSWYLSKKASRSLYDADFQAGDALIFGPETRGLPEDLLHAVGAQALRIFSGCCLRDLHLNKLFGLKVRGDHKENQQEEDHVDHGSHVDFFIPRVAW